MACDFTNDFFLNNYFDVTFLSFFSIKNVTNALSLSEQLCANSRCGACTWDRGS